MNTIPDCFSCWHKKLFATVWTPIWYATFHSRDRVCIESWILEINLPRNFQTWIKSGKMVECSVFFKATIYIYIYFFFILVIFNFIHTFAVKRALFLHCLRSLLVTYLIALSLKEEKSLEKPWILDPKICMNPVGNSSALQLHSFTEITILMC